MTEEGGRGGTKHSVRGSSGADLDISLLLSDWCVSNARTVQMSSKTNICIVDHDEDK